MISRGVIFVLALLAIGCKRPEPSGSRTGHPMGLSPDNPPVSADAPLYVLDRIPVADETARQFGIRAIKARKDGSANQSPEIELLFSKQGIRTALIETIWSGAAAGPSRAETRYDSSGRPREQVFSTAEGVDLRVSYEYELAAEWQRKVRRKPNGVVLNTIDAKRDSFGRLASTTMRNAKGENDEASSENYRYDSVGRLIHVDMGLHGEWTLEYDSQGRLSRKTGVLPKMSICGHTYEFEYGRRGLLQRIVRPPVGEVACGTLVLEYDFGPSGDRDQ